MTDNFIQLGKSNELKFEIRTDDGKSTGEYLTFDLEDIELPLKYQEMLNKDKKNRDWLRNQMLIIDKRQDVKGKKLLSKNEEDKVRAINDFLEKEVEIFNMFLGENGVQKLLNGRKLGWTSLKEIDLIIEKQIAPKLNIKMEDITAMIKEKYGNKEEKDVLQ